MIDERAQKLPRSARLRHRRDFLLVQKQGRSVATRLLILLCRENTLSHRRLGVTVSTRVSKRAVDRNRIKRLFREIYRRTRTRFPEASDIVIIARHPAQGASYAQIAAALEEAAARLPRPRKVCEARGASV